MDIRLVNPITFPNWDEMVMSHPDCSVFHGSGWTRVLARTYRHAPEYIVSGVCRDPLTVLPLMAVESALTGRRGVCLPFTDFCPPLVFDDNGIPPVMERLATVSKRNRWRYVEMRSAASVRPNGPPSLGFHGHSVDLCGGAECVFARLHGSNRQAIRKAEGSDLRAQATDSDAAIREYYRLHTKTRRRHGLPPQPLAFFLNIHRELIQSGQGFVLLAAHGMRTVAGGIFLHMGAKAIYKFGASEPEFQHLRGNNLVIWTAIKTLINRGIHTLHLGRVSLDHEGLRRFKLSWGATEEKLEYQRFDPATGANFKARDNVAGFHNAIFSRMPHAINRMAGTLLYPHLD